MKRMIFLRCMLICIAALVISEAFSAYILSYTKERETERNMRQMLEVFTSDTPATDDWNALARRYAALSGGNRITFISDGGRVLGDSQADPAQMDNHAARPEVAQALQSGSGSAKRASETMDGQRTLYIAVQYAEDCILRMAVPLDSLQTGVSQMLPAMVAGIIAALSIAPLLARKTAGAILAPLDQLAESLARIADGKCGEKSELPKYEELIPIVNSINAISGYMSSTVRQLAGERKKMDYLLGSMDQGLVIIDSNLKVLTVNSSAARFLKASENTRGKNILHLTHIRQIVDAITDAVKRQKSVVFDYETGTGEILSIHITPVSGSWVSDKKEAGARAGAVMLMTDVTHERQIGRMKEEFVANASHELKTPITTIKGFSELLQVGVVQDEEQKRDYLQRIIGEASRMTSIIDDILKIASYESGGEAEKPCAAVDLLEVCRGVAENLLPQAAEKGISIRVEGASVQVEAVYEDIRQLAINLIENAVKYNRQGGSVEVRVKRDGTDAVLTVEDTGIGIPVADQARVFERFYRVDKGRSRKIGGTGLGLSIVKHIAAKYQARLTLTSREGVGTKIRVIFAGGARTAKTP